MQYEEIRIALGESREGELSDWLAERGLGFQLADQTTLDPPPRGQVRFHLYVPPSEGPGLLQQLGAQLGPEAEVTVRSRDEDEWRDAWKRYFTTRRLGRLAIVPSWEVAAHQPAPDEVTLQLDPGRAFGTGGHASTRLCLRLLEGLSSAGEAPLAPVLDVGCGCGVLAIAALLLDASGEGVAVDIDPEAVEVTLENADLNHVGARLRVATTPVQDVQGGFAVVLANLSGPTLLELAEPLAARVAVGGRLIVSGILTTEAPGIAARFAALGLPLQSHEEEEEWSALLLGPAGVAAR